jgi:nucleoside-diphosphate-sugar epimerase
MRLLVTGSAGHLGEALVRTLRDSRHEVVGIDVFDSPYTSSVGSITDRPFVRRCMAGVRAVFHAAALHKPHVATHSRQDFVDVNATGTLNLLEEATAAGVDSFVFTSTTSVFGDALAPPAGAPAAWVTDDVASVPKNIYGVTKATAEDFCQLFHRNQGLACLVLRTSRFFPEEDDDKSVHRGCCICPSVFLKFLRFSSAKLTRCTSTEISDRSRTQFAGKRSADTGRLSEPLANRVRSHRQVVHRSFFQGETPWITAIVRCAVVA